MIKLKPTDQRVLDYLKENPTGLTVRECIRKLKTTELRKISFFLTCVADCAIMSLSTKRRHWQ